MDTIEIPLEDLEPDPCTVRKHSKRYSEAIVNSLAEFGQVKPIIVLKRRGKSPHVVVAGNGTLEAANKMGWASLRAVVFNGTKAQARAYAIADNRTAELAAWDSEELLAQLEDLDALTLAAGFTEQEFEDLRAAFGPPPDLDSLASQVGDPFGDGLVRISFRVSEDVAEHWKKLVTARGISDGDEAAADLILSIK